MESANSFILTENFEMLKALYDFQAVYPKTISFDEGEHFILYQTSARQRNWWQVVSMKGAIGFVPSNYVMKIKVEPSFLLGFLDSSIESLKISKETEINGIIARLELIERLEEKKTQITLSAKALENDVDNISRHENRYISNNGSVKSKEFINYNNQVTTTMKNNDSPSTPTQMPPQLLNESPSLSSMLDMETPAIATTQQIATTTNTSTHHDNSITSDRSETTNTTSDDATVISKAEVEIDNDDNNDENSQQEQQPSITKTKQPKSMSSATSPITVATSTTLDGISNGNLGTRKHYQVSQNQVYQIIDSLRQTTRLSHEMSSVALRVVLSELETIFSTDILEFLEPIADHLSEPLSAPDDFIEHSHDAQRLRIIFAQLADCKNDSEQRTWMLYEDEEDITRFLVELVEILNSADKKICKYELIYDQYQSVINLVQYYQMETRWPIRKILLDAFKALCHLETNAIDLLLTSVLPMELVHDMKSNAENLDRVKEIVVMLTMIFSIGQKIPINHQETIGTDFILYLLNTIENPPEYDVHDILSDLMINLLLSINLQFDNFTESFVLDAMQQVQSAKTFTEKILILLNREEDPLNFYEHTKLSTNSVLKMFVDLFTTSETASLFYSNDNKVLIDILVRQLSDLSPGDPLRRWYLELCRRIVRNTDYSTHSHRKTDLIKIFTRIFCEESECSLKDQQLVREIANEFPQIFKA